MGKHEKGEYGMESIGDYNLVSNTHIAVFFDSLKLCVKSKSISSLILLFSKINVLKTVFKRFNNYR